jgi:hypothetical protein
MEAPAKAGGFRQEYIRIRKDDPEQVAKTIKKHW